MIKTGPMGARLSTGQDYWTCIGVSGKVSDLNSTGQMHVRCMAEACQMHVRCMSEGFGSRFYGTTQGQPEPSDTRTRTHDHITIYGYNT